MGDSEDKFFDIRQLLGDTLLITRTVNYKYFRDELKSVSGDLKVTGRSEAAENSISNPLIIPKGRASELGKVPALATLNKAELEALAVNMQARCYSHGEVILKSGETPQSMWLIAEGTCIITNQDNLQRVIGSTLTHIPLGRGDCFGFLSLCTPKAEINSVLASGDVVTFHVGRREFAESLLHPLVQFNIISRYQQAKDLERDTKLLDKLYSDPVTKQLLNDFTISTRTDENFHFWLDICDLKAIAWPSQDFTTKATAIYDKYIKEGHASSEININKPMRDKIAANIGSPGKGIFTELEALAFKDLNKDVIPRFIKSKAFLSYAMDRFTVPGLNYDAQAGSSTADEILKSLDDGGGVVRGKAGANSDVISRSRTGSSSRERLGSGEIKPASGKGDSPLGSSGQQSKGGGAVPARRKTVAPGQLVPMTGALVRKDSGFNELSQARSEAEGRVRSGSGLLLTGEGTNTAGGGNLNVVVEKKGSCIIL